MATRPVSDQDRRRNFKSVPLSDTELAAIDQARGEMPLGQWLREAAHEKLARDGYDVTDEARRSAARRQNQRQRQQREEG